MTILSEMDTIAEDIIGRRPGQDPTKPISGIEPLAEAMEAGIDLDDEDDAPPKKKKKVNEGRELVTELDAAAVLDADMEDVELEEETPAKKKGKKTDDEDEEEAELVGAGAGKGKPAAKPKGGRRKCWWA